jgi:hypothetical protein
MAQAKAWHDDPAYAPLIKLRQAGSDLDFILVEAPEAAPRSRRSSSVPESS